MRGRKITYGILTACVGIICLFVIIDFNASKKLFIITFGKSGTVGHTNDNGRFDGEAESYINGQLIKKATFKNGLLDGLTTCYYSNGAIKSKTFFKKDNVDGIETTFYIDGKIKSKESFKNGAREGPKILYYRNGQIEQESFRKNNRVSGPERVYYENGNLKYKRTWVNNKLYGDFYYYNNKKDIEIYNAYDVLGDKFYLCRYNSSGMISKSDGNVFSSRTYSITNDSIVVLETRHAYKSIRDLYITVANPPQSTTEVQVTVNGSVYKNLIFRDPNTVMLKDVFNHIGFYSITVEGIFVGKSVVTDQTSGNLSIEVK